MNFSFRYDKQPEKFLRKLPQQQALRIMDTIERTLADNPVPASAKTIIGEHGVFRIRVGSYRALYRIDHGARTIVIVKIDRRERVYE